MKRMKKLITMALVGALIVGTVVTSSAAELDLAWYAAKNPDVVAAFGNSPEMLKLHYEMFGRKEARMANSHDAEAQLRRLFNPTEYGKLYPDVQAAFVGNAEAMFQHYLAYGLLEGRRPSEKVSKATAANLKKAVEKAMASAGIPAVPGSVELVAAITGEIQTNIADAAVQQIVAQVASVVEKAVTETVKAVNNPGSSGGGGGSSSSSGESGGSGVTPSAQKYTWAIADGEGAAETRLFAKGATGDYTLVTAKNAEYYFDVSDGNPDAEPELKAKAECTYTTNPGKIKMIDKMVADYVDYAPAGVSGVVGGKEVYVLKGLTDATKDSFFEADEDTGEITNVSDALFYNASNEYMETETVTGNDYVGLTGTFEVADAENNKLYKEDVSENDGISTAYDFGEGKDDINKLFTLGGEDGTELVLIEGANVYIDEESEGGTLTQITSDNIMEKLRSDSSEIISIEYGLGNVKEGKEGTLQVAAKINEEENFDTYVTMGTSGDPVFAAGAPAIYEKGENNALTPIRQENLRSYFTITLAGMSLKDKVVLYSFDGEELNFDGETTKITDYFMVYRGKIVLQEGAACYIGTDEEATQITLDDYDAIKAYVTIARYVSS